MQSLVRHDVIPFNRNLGLPQLKVWFRLANLYLRDPIDVSLHFPKIWSFKKLLCKRDIESKEKAPLHRTKGFWARWTHHWDDNPKVRLCQQCTKTEMLCIYTIRIAWQSFYHHTVSLLIIKCHLTNYAVTRKQNPANSCNFSSIVKTPFLQSRQTNSIMSTI